MKKRRKILDLKPTQFAVGMLEVDEKIKIVEKYNKRRLRKFIDGTPVPVVVGPDRQLYVIDHHHFLVVCYHVGVEKVKVAIQKDLSKSKFTYSTFWKWMFKTRNAYPFCQFGEGPRKAVYLPRDIRGLADDPYRSLAWYVRRAGAFENSHRNYAEFKWANFFRARRLLDHDGLPGLPKALVKAVALAQSPAARGLPGYGKLNLEEKSEAVRKAKGKASVLRKKKK